MSREIEQFFVDAEAYVSQGKAMLEQSRELDLGAMDALADVLAIQANRLGAEAQKNDPERFAALMQGLETLVQEIEARRGTVAMELKNLIRHRRAGAAYYNASNADNH